MPPAAQNSKAISTLVIALRARADRLPEEATETSTLLRQYASEIEDLTTSDEALERFNATAVHYKGLRDLLVPGVGDGEWFSFVDEARRLSKAAVRARGLDKTLLGKLHALFGRPVE